MKTAETQLRTLIYIQSYIGICEADWLKLSRSAKIAIAALFLGGGYGVALHAIAGELYDKGGYKEILSFQGE